jgi:hypothetical protein
LTAVLRVWFNPEPTKQLISSVFQTIVFALVDLRAKRIDLLEKTNPTLCLRLIDVGAAI